VSIIFDRYAQAPTTRPEYLKRVKTRYSTTREIHYPNSKEAIEYKKWLASNLKKLHVLGQFRNKFVMEHQDIILDTELTPFEKSIRIWTAIYESNSSFGSNNKKLPEFFNKQLDEHQMADSIEDRKSDISNALQAWIVDKCSILDKSDDKILNRYTDSSYRLAQLIDRKLVPYVRRDNDENVVFFRKIVIDLQNDYGLKHIDLSILSDVIPNARYGKLEDGYKVVKCSMKNLEEFFGEKSVER
jgi:hypothetical protein